MSNPLTGHKKMNLFLERRLTASRQSQGTAVKEHLVLQIFSPVESGGQWKCEYSLSTSPLRPAESDEAYGEDGLQALINAIEAARQLIASRFPDASWLSNTNGDIGFPIIVSPYVPLSNSDFRLLQNNIWRLVNAFLKKLMPTRKKLRKSKLETRKPGH